MSIVKVDQEKCIGCGACVAIDPENFDFNDEGISTVINEIAAEAAKDAEEACPVLAIDIIENEETTNEKEVSDEDKDEKEQCDKCECDHECDCDDCDSECCCDDCECDECEGNHEDENEKEDE